ncbi:HD domain-containing protein [Flavobacterium sp. F-380]|uniref:HD domain-containing protein n=1 Tax=Flavobacterium kayseriense TaxID=2764714 RepID=A0ABR7J9U3_9FLAO|nr:Pycsar system effector family protein [Flavobacterium kayseriense]MBC5842275.1 HD domain-containing protein [Flavobacterium kayseriense]MBC5848805.1 HD domain-containing protein [Flavobacterium kayseriense]
MNLIEQAENFVCKLLKDKLSDSYTYHNFNHTLEVVNAVKTLAIAEDLNEVDTEMVLIAAWFHDTGYINGCDKHEISSSKIVPDFLIDKQKSSSYIETVCDVIQATTYNYNPTTVLAKVIRDADYHHFTTDDYFDRCELLREEWRVMRQIEYNDLEWAKENLKVLRDYHTYYTDYARTHWEPLKQKNIKLIEETIKNIELNTTNPLTKDKPKKKKSKKVKPDRGVDTLFRVTLNNHTRLSGIADSKANILLSVNAIIISIALSSIIPKLDSPRNTHLIIPTFVLLMFSVVSIIFAILSTRPKVTKGVFTRQDIEDKKVNLLFFGNFYRMPLEEYEWAVNEMMKDNEYLYNSMIKDLYFLGLVLEKKYKLLRITYNVFMVGLIISVIAFVIAFNSSSI